MEGGSKVVSVEVGGGNAQTWEEGYEAQV